jgi:hypothetical protein
MPKFLEDKLRAEYGNNPSAIYGTMNKIGAMHGNKETAKGREMETKHEADMKNLGKIRSMRIEIHRGPGMKVTGHTIHHEMMPKKASPGGAFMEETHHSFPFDGNGQSSTHGDMMDHIAGHLGMDGAVDAKGPAAPKAEELEDEEGEE